MMTTFRPLSPALALIMLMLSSVALATPGTAARVLIFGEQHDQPDQQRQVAEEVRQRAAAGQLAGVVLEMAEAPHNTAALPRDAGEAQVRDALQWKGWPWQAYAAVVMNAVRAGVPVWGGNLPRAGMRAVMADSTLDAQVDAATRDALAGAVRAGHCNLLPASQEPGMVRIQIARDRSMAAVVESLLREAGPARVVLLLTGAQHASRDRGVPLHLDTVAPATSTHVVIFGEQSSGGLRADEWRSAVFTPQEDHCAGLRQRLAAPAAASAPASAASR